MKLANSLMALAVILVLAVGIGAKCWKKNENWNVFETETPAEDVFRPLNEFIVNQEGGKYPEWRDVADLARKEVSYIMVYYSHGPHGYQVAFWDGEYGWIFNSADGKTYRMTEDISRIAWYDVENCKLLTPKEAKQQQIEYARL